MSCELYVGYEVVFASHPEALEGRHLGTTIYSTESRRVAQREITILSSCCGVETHYLRCSCLNSQPSTPNSNLPTANPALQTQHSRLRTSDSELPTQTHSQNIKTYIVPEVPSVIVYPAGIGNCLLQRAEQVILDGSDCQYAAAGCFYNRIFFFCSCMENQ